MKDTQKTKIAQNYHLLRRVESWKCYRVTAFICPNCDGIQTMRRDARNTSKTKAIFLSPEIVKLNSFLLFLLMMMNSASASVKCFEYGQHIFCCIHRPLQTLKPLKSSSSISSNVVQALTFSGTPPSPQESYKEFGY